jgi:predicted TPR repeat methyltransferase
MDRSDTSVRKLTIEETISIAILLQKNKQFSEAHKLLQLVLEAKPDYPRGLHYAGVLAHQQGRNDEAVALIERSLELSPDEPDWWSNLGILQQSNDRLDLAIEAYRHAIRIDPGHANAHSNLGVVLRAVGRPAEAEAEYREAVRLDPGHIDAYTNLGILLNGLGRTEEASACYCKVITLRPRHREARRLLALAHATLGEVDRAREIYEEWLDEEPENPIARHMLAACTGQQVPERASDGFIEITFDNFAAGFEAKLESLAYRAPVLIGAVLQEAGLPPSGCTDALDVGCGTGLCGPIVAPLARRLVGVDLSAGMLALAEEKKVYHSLVKAELVDYLSDKREAFDLIVSADALVYFGNLARVIPALAAALRPNGLLAFTLEHVADENGLVNYRLERHGRYSHGRKYVESLLAASGLQPKIHQAQLRMEAGVPVPGLVVRATKPGALMPRRSIRRLEPA